jgi:hypothetical protein
MRLVPALMAMALCAAALAAVPGGRDPLAAESALLPDLDQELPWDLEITGSGRGARGQYRLGFRSAVRNIGDGPLIVSGRRDRAANATMTADQLIEGQGAPIAVVEGVPRRPATPAVAASAQRLACASSRASLSGTATTTPRTSKGSPFG